MPLSPYPKLQAYDFLFIFSLTIHGRRYTLFWVLLCCSMIVGFLGIPVVSPCLPSRWLYSSQLSSISCSRFGEICSLFRRLTTRRRLISTRSPGAFPLLRIPLRPLRIPLRSLRSFPLEGLDLYGSRLFGLAFYFAMVMNPFR